MRKIIKCLDFVIYWLIILIPFSMAIAPAPMNVFMGLLIFAFLVKKILKREGIFTQTQINIPLLFLFIATCLSLFNSIDYRDSFKGGIFRLLEYILIFFIIAQEVKDRQQIKKIILSVTAGIILASFDGIWQVFSGRDFIRGYTPVVNLGLIRATAAFKDANTLGIYLSGITPLVLGLTLFYFKNKEKIIFILLSLIALIGIMLTFSRPTLLAIYIALFFLGVIRRNKPVIIFLITIVFLSPFILPQSIKDWAKEVGYNPLRFMCNDDRIAVYRNSLNMIKKHPFIGVGANTYMKNYKKYKESPEYRNIVTSDYLYAHNIFLHMASEIGLIGLAIFIWLLSKLFAQARSIYRLLGDHYLKIVSLSLSACLIAFLVNGLTESSLYYSRVAVLFWYISGLLLALKKIAFGNNFLRFSVVRKVLYTFLHHKKFIHADRA